jgi:hypothetical protein
LVYPHHGELEYRYRERDIANLCVRKWGAVFCLAALVVRLRVPVLAPVPATEERLSDSQCASMIIWKRGHSNISTAFIYPSATGILRPCISNAEYWFNLAQSRTPGQPKVESMRVLVYVWPRAEVGSNIWWNIADTWSYDLWEKNSVRTEYSADALSIRAALKCRKGTSG